MTTDATPPRLSPIPMWTSGPGISLRDWFAGQALAGLVARGQAATDGVIPIMAYELADAVLAERAASQERGNG